jgi:hypothetical protein
MVDLCSVSTNEITEISSIILSRDQKDSIDAHAFLGKSTYLDRLALKPISHICPYWELTWDDEKAQYIPEDGSFAEELNEVLTELNRIIPPDNYHKFEDELIEHVSKQSGNTLFNHEGEWLAYIKGEIKKAEYDHALERGSFHDPYEFNLLKAVAGRIKEALERGQTHFDDMEHYHQLTLAAIITVILYKRSFL